MRAEGSERRGRGRKTRSFESMGAQQPGAPLRAARAEQGRQPHFQAADVGTWGLSLSWRKARPQQPQPGRRTGESAYCRNSC
eukprot:364586-Chlamydomonas_euryale.AAC.11